MTAVFVAIALILLLVAREAGGKVSWTTVMQSVAFALVVALAVRWLNIVFEEKQPVRDLYASSKAELMAAIGQARKTIWICQTWLPGAGGDASMILDREVADTRLMLASFAPRSPVFARIDGRLDVDEDLAKSLSAASVREFVTKGLSHQVRFNAGHHPGWIAVIDSDVFWGATPVHKDNWVAELLFHRAPNSDPRARFWIEQFEMLWNKAHRFDEERQYSEKLAEIHVGDRRQPGR